MILHSKEMVQRGADPGDNVVVNMLYACWGGGGMKSYTYTWFMCKQIQLRWNTEKSVVDKLLDDRSTKPLNHRSCIKAELLQKQLYLQFQVLYLTLNPPSDAGSGSYKPAEWVIILVSAS